VEQAAYGKSSLVVTELPYQVNKQRVVESIAKLARDGKLPGVTDLRDESDRDGVRIVLSLKRDVDSRKILKRLFRKTQLQYTFGVIALALVDGVPRQLNLKEALEVWIEHRLDVIVRRATFNLERAEARAHILEGLLVALDRIDEVVEIIKSSRTPETAARNLRSALKITAEQARAILAMRLSQLTNLESRKLKEELGQLSKRIRTLKAILADEKRRRDLVRRELNAVAEKYGDARRTEILDDNERFPLPSGEAEQEMHVFHTYLGYLKTLPARSARDDGGLAAAESLEEARDDFVTDLWLCKSDDQLLAFTWDGQVHASRIGDLPQGTLSSRGKKLLDLLQLDEPPVALHTVRDFSEDRYVVTVTRYGKVKRSPLSDYANIRAGGIIAAGVDEGDDIVAARISGGSDDLVLATRGGQVIRFPESDVRAMGRNAAGVKGIELDEGDEVVAFLVPRREATLLAASVEGYVRLLDGEDLRLQSRGGKGVKLMPGGQDTGEVVGLLDVLSDDAVLAITESGDAVSIDPQNPAGNGRAAKRPVPVPLKGRRLTEVRRAVIRRSAPRTGQVQMSLQI
jgi:DNA gyrase subunit A